VAGDAGTGTTPERGAVGAPGFPGWKYLKPIKMDTTPAGAGVMGEVTGFPVAVVLTAMNFDFSQAKDMGEDIRFGKADGTPLPYAIESWNKAGQTAALWVRVDRVAGNSADQSINMYWGNAGAGDAADSKAVFPAADGFLGVWHLGEDGSTTAGGYPDASGAGNDATGVNLMPGSRIDGRIGSGTKTVNAMEQWIRVEDTAVKFRPAMMTSSLWGRAASFPGRSGPGGYDTIFSSGEFWTMQKFSLNRVFETCFSNNCAVGKAQIATNTWYHFAVVRMGTSQRFYVNGVRDATGAVSTRMDSKPLGIGNQTQYLTNAREKRSWDGILDEARVIAAVKDDNWIKLDFESQKEASKFLSFGTTQTR
jgi:biopolymer transport protein ExbB